MIRGPFWPEPVRVLKSKKSGENIIIFGTTVDTNSTVNSILTREDLERVEVMRTTDFGAEPHEFFMGIESYRLRNASLFDSYLAMNTSRIDPLPFQLEAVYGYALRMPHMRFMIADDPGAGKTIMAGMIIKELKLRGVASRVLIVTPGHLKAQWQREMKDKFQENFVIMDRPYMSSRQGENPWMVENSYITSIDFAKQEDVMSSLSSTRWDLVVVDEAHKMSARIRSENKKDMTRRYRLGQILSRTSDHMLLLTATPHSGDPDAFRLLLDLLRPGFFSNPELIQEARRNRDNPLFIRRVKEELRDFDGKPIFPRRYTHTHSFNLSDAEMELYNEISRYITEQYNRAIATDRRAHAFAMMLLQRRMASSIYAVMRSLMRKRDRCIQLMENIESLSMREVSGDYSDLLSVDYSDLEERRIWEIESSLEGSTLADSIPELKAEVSTLEGLIEDAERLLKSGSETKLMELQKILEEIGHEKILIFSESKDTVDYLLEKIESWGYSVCTIHGGMSMDERIAAEDDFRRNKQVMVATEAAGEGINLQFCHIMVNYDIPWNPNRLEQRMGRIHRYKQRRDVHIYNLVAGNTREGLVMRRLLEKLDSIRQDIGSDKVYDVIGEIYTERDISRIIEMTLRGEIRDEEIEELLKPQEDILKRIMDEQLAVEVDYTRMKDIQRIIKERKLAPEYVEEFFRAVFKKMGWKYTERNGMYTLRTPRQLLRLWDDELRRRYGALRKEYRNLTFNPGVDEGEFISFGHPLLEATIRYTGKRFGDSLLRGSTFRDPSGRYRGTVWFYRGRVTDGRNESAGERVFALYDNGEEVVEVSPMILWDLVPDRHPVVDEINEEGVTAAATESVMRYMDKLKDERKRKTGIKRKYGLRSIKYLIDTSQEKLLEYYDRLDQGEDMGIAIRNEEERLEEYKERMRELEREMEMEETLTASPPELLGVIHVEAPEIPGREDIEMIGMKITMEHERRHGRIPEDVSGENLGFDVRSISDSEIRYIEVKARRGRDNVELTQNEWLKARRFRENYWLYVVYNAGTDPELTVIQDPYSNLEPLRREEVRYIVPAEQIRRMEE
ncbi:putative helicase [Methanothermobacter sp. CaT2]|uniref:helicase-related protein n=1 Tax=Methanothermobacter sp. CaT2 TaxID=866790 RepID=UPI0002CD0E29|nr:helicase-related protein [Methanothermobacter sp. CaT2]BAM69722.1 putative helicase [Methanothermobacter sp. CaT2]